MHCLYCKLNPVATAPGSVLVDPQWAQLRQRMWGFCRGACRLPAITAKTWTPNAGWGILIPVNVPALAHQWWLRLSCPWSWSDPRSAEERVRQLL